MTLTFTPDHIMLPSYIFENADWYLPQNRAKVQAHRKYYCSLIKHFQGNHALYVDERVIDKHYINNIFKSDFEQTLIEKYGKFPKYYIDEFSDIKT